MKYAKGMFLLILAGLVAVGVATTAHSFHSGGVAECEGCHSMHSPKTGGVDLLVGTDPSSACLTCHEHAGDTGPSSYHISTAPGDMAATAPLQRTPGGDFGWVKKSWDEAIDPDQKHGHNIVAFDFGYSVDDNNVYAPGSGDTYLASQLGCQSCHDPHGQARRTPTGYARGGVIGQAATPIIASGSYNNSPNPSATGAVGLYRILRGVGDTYQGVTFAGAPIAVAPSTYNQSEQTNQVRVAYGAQGTNTWGAWCGTCHGEMHTAGANLTHPVDVDLNGLTAFYNAYKMSGDLTGTQATAFSSLVPFAEATGDYTVLKTHAVNNGSVLSGPSTSDKVMCLSCHRAHASGSPEMLRFPYHYEFMTVNGNYIGMDNPLMTSSRAPVQTLRRPMAAWQAAVYDRPVTQFATYQRVLCNKCHAKD